MKKYIKNLLLAVCGVLAFSSCSEEDVPVYDVSQHYLYIPIEDDMHKQSLSFTHHPGDDFYDMEVTVRLAGMALEEDRPYKLQVVDTLTTALPEDYVLDMEQVFHAGVYEDKFTVRLNKSPHVIREEVTLAVCLVPNEYFKVAEYMNNPEWSTMKRSITAYFTFNNKISQPAWWDERIENYYLGAYSDNKFEAFIVYMGSIGELPDLTDVPSVKIREYMTGFSDFLANDNGQWVEKDGTQITIPF